MVRFRPSSGYLDPRPFVSQGSGRAELSRSTRLGSRAASGGSPRPLRKEAGRCGEQSPGVPGLMEPWSRSWRWHWRRWVPVLPRRRRRGAPPKVQETVGDLSFVVSRGEMKVEGVGLVVGLDNTGVDAAAVVVSQAARRRDEQGRRRERREAAGESPGLDGDRAADDSRSASAPPTGSTSRSRSRRPAARPAWPAATC